MLQSLLLIPPVASPMARVRPLQRLATMSPLMKRLQGCRTFGSHLNRQKWQNIPRGMKFADRQVSPHVSRSQLTAHHVCR